MLWLFIFACVAVEIVSKDKDLLNNPDTGAIVERLSWCIGSPADWIKLYPLSTS